MFGVLTPAQDYLTDEQQTRYKSWYCGLCRTIGQDYGQLYRTTLTYDLNFLQILLSALYEPELHTSKGVCFVHPVCPRERTVSRYTHYAAALNIILAYYKCLDNWNDDGSIVMKWTASAMEPVIADIAAEYPRQSAAIREGIEKLSAIELSGETVADIPADCFGNILAELFVPDENDYWAEELRRFGYALGKFIYLKDAASDLEADSRRNRYNPFRAMPAELQTEQFFREALSLVLGDCVASFEKLPILKDSDLMNNILCVGIWADKKGKKSKKDATSHVSGSV